jgi:hypothetical protein
MPKLPFLNRKRYIVLKCYTNHAGVHKHSPMTLGDDDVTPQPTNPEYLSKTQYFSHCWSRLETRKRSATVRSPAAFRVVSDGQNSVSHSIARDEETFRIVFDHDSDETYGTDRHTFLSKLAMPWKCYEETGVNFVMARHMRNKTQMNILSGVTSFKVSPDINIFNLISKDAHRYEVSFNTPLISIYPMSDLPLHVESYFDPEKFAEVSQLGYMPCFRSSARKKEKHSCAR